MMIACLPCWVLGVGCWTAEEGVGIWKAESLSGDAEI